MQSEWNPSKWDSTAESESESNEEVEVSPFKEATCVYQACSVTVQKLKTQQECPEGQEPRNLPPPLKHVCTSAWPYTLVELVELAAKFHQKGSESTTGWLLHFWDTDVDRIILSGDDPTQMASVITLSSLCQCIH